MSELRSNTKAFQGILGNFKAMLHVESPHVFSVQNYEFGNQRRKRYSFKTAKGRILKFRT